MTNTNISTWTIFTNMPGYLPEGEPEPFEATHEEALSALLDEAEFQLDSDESDEENELLNSDLALVAYHRGHEGRSDLMFTLEQVNSVGIHLESYANGFGGTVTLARVLDRS